MTFPATLDGQQTPRPAYVVVARRAVSVLSWLLLLLIALNVYFAGAMLFADGDYRDAHEGLGWLLPYLPVVTFIAAIFAKLRWTFWVSFAVLFVLMQAQPMLAFWADSGGNGFVAAFHPLNAMVLAGLAYHHARWKAA